MRRFIAIILCLNILINGCKTSQVQPPGEFPQPNWVERRMDRLETWNRHHGYPIEKTRNATNFVLGCTILVVGAAAYGYAYLALESELDKLAEPQVPHHR